jgi:hypothetical protein
MDHPRRATLTHLPNHGAALADVVAAFERSDREALVAALDNADGALLNYIPVHFGYSLPVMPAAVTESCYFNAIRENATPGSRPTSLLSCATHVLATRPWTCGPSYAWIHCGKDDDWIATYAALAFHPKIDINKHVSENQDDANFEAWVEAHGGHGVCTHDAGFSDFMTPFDYVLTAHLRQVRAGDPQAHFTRRMLVVLASTGKVALWRGLTHWQNDNSQHAWYRYDANNLLRVAYEHGKDDVLLFLLQNPRTPEADLVECLRDLLKKSSTRKGEADYIVRRMLILPRLRHIKRQEVLKRMCKFARWYILLMRAWADARHRLFAPGGNGHGRARLSYEAARDAGGIVVD